MSKKLLLPAFVLFGIGASAQCSDLFFSEYIEGSSNNKALEIYNPTSATINLTDYVIYRANNGSPVAQDSLFPQDVLAPGDVWVAGNPSAVPTILSQSDTLHTITFFNGDDVLWIKKISTGITIDVIGQLGVDPGTNWPVGTGATSEFTLVRMVGIQQGTTSWTQAQNEYLVYPANTDTTLGHHFMSPCCTAPNLSLLGVVDNLCFGDASGSIQITATGDGPLTFSWVNRPETVPVLTGLSAGTYTAVVVGACGSDSLVVVVTEPTQLQASITSQTNPSCFGSTDGSVTVAASGSVPGYTYLWSNGQTASTASGLADGAYTVTVTCTNGCTAITGAVITQPAPVTPTFTFSMDTLCQIDPGMYALAGSPTGGTWSGTGVIGSDFSPSTAGVGLHYITYTYTDTAGCSGTAVDSVYVEMCIGLNEIKESQFVTYPNPFTNELTVQFGDATTKTISIYNLQGELVYSVVTTQATARISTEELSSGMYFLQVNDGNSTTTQKIQKAE